tara:strand:- start:1003 stop:2004 length:1002 start_codon:yes stop_codon:yes gene_type:complete
MARKLSGNIGENEVTDESVYLSRRSLLKGFGAAILGYHSPPLYSGQSSSTENKFRSELHQMLFQKINSRAKEDLKKLADSTPFKYASSYNNFYEFGSGKSDPKKNAKKFVTDPWEVSVQGECDGAGIYHLEDLVRPHLFEERIYRLRCVEAWSMVIPWVGLPLASLIKKFKPRSNAKYIKFETLYDPNQMPGQKSLFSAIEYPYVEALRMDEATNKLSFLALGMYGKLLPNQNGAPIRLVVPWKYGFKSIKSIVKIEFVQERPITTWMQTNPKEYGFYSNVNPSVDHPRWSQATERRLPSSIFSPNIRPTEMFNGYGDEVAHLYRGMDLRKFY